MFVRRFRILLSVFVLLLFPGMVCHGEESTALAQAYTWEQNVDMYIAGEIKPDSLGCKCSNQGLEIVDSGLLADRGVTVRTTILLDISASVPKDMRDNVKIYLDRLIQDIPENEQYKLVTFDEELTVLQDFTNDRYDLSNAAEGIDFDGQESRIYDAIYNTMPSAEPVEGNPCYYRTIVITDGIDDTASGITKEELYLKLQADTYPVEVVAVSSAEQSEAEKELSALTRISGGRYVNLHADGDLETVLSGLAVDSIYWVRAKLPAELLDGSLRPFVLTDGTVSLQFDVRVSAVDLPAGEGSGSSAGGAETGGENAEGSSGASEAPESSRENGTSGEASESTESTDNGLSESNDSGDNTGSKTENEESGSAGGQGVGAAGAGSVPEGTETGGIIGTVKGIVEKYPFVLAAVAAAVILLIGIIVFIAVGGKKKKGKTAGKADETKTGVSTGGNYGDTEILGGNVPKGTDGSACIRIRDASHPEQVWSLSLSDTIAVGRVTDCQICVADESVSRKQCLIYLVDNIPTIENKSNSNITRLNGDQLNVPRPLKAGDKIKCGRVTLIVDSFYRGTGGEKGPLNKDTRFVNV
ncbi:FHA domain-containing protein [Acetatifactor muris]|uniref:FHA domain-containing protein n=1 Tax=Acetatifactor muris TaxID=879566 RepID=UPI0023F40739|nr:FHA domain-containing protein [Acetatifactor muris]